MSEPFDAGKLVKSPFTGLFWVKVVMYMLGMLTLVFVGYGVYKAYFKKPDPTQHQTQEIKEIVVEKGATLNLGQQTGDIKKRKWYIPAPFVDVYSFVETNDQKGVGVRFGGRFEF